MAKKSSFKVLTQLDYSNTSELAQNIEKASILKNLNILGFSFTLLGKDQRMFQDLPRNLFEAPSKSKMAAVSST